MQAVRKNIDIIISRSNEGDSVAGAMNWAVDNNGRDDKHCFGEDELV
jgi:hypothetical protein